jgi:hypothetical protein
MVGDRRTGEMDIWVIDIADRSEIFIGQNISWHLYELKGNQPLPGICSCTYPSMMHFAKVMTTRDQGQSRLRKPLGISAPEYRGNVRITALLQKQSIALCHAST